MYQAIPIACRAVRGLTRRALLAASLSGAAACAVAPNGSGQAALSPVEAAESPAEKAPLAKVTYTSRQQTSLDLNSRVKSFDRIAFSSPSAVLHDRDRDVYWVSNVNAGGLDRPGKGFISKLDPEGSVATLNFIDSRHAGTTLESPRGLAVAGDVLYVADIAAIRRFKADDGAPMASIDIPGATYLSDVAVAADGSLYAVDLGSPPDALADASGDAVYQITSGGEVSTVARRPSLGGPAALIADERGLWIACAETTDLLLLIPGSGGEDTPDAGRLDLPGTPRGIVAMPDGTLLISSTSDGAVYRGSRDGPFARIVEGLEAPADLGYDTLRKRLLIPLFSGHALAVFELLPLPNPLDPAP